MAIPRTLQTLEVQKFIECPSSSNLPAVKIYVCGARDGVFDTNVVSVPKLKRLPIPAANTEVSYTFPVNTKRFLIKNPGNALIKFAYTAGDVAGGDYGTIDPGGTYDEQELETSSGLTIYVESIKAGELLEVRSWA